MEKLPLFVNLPVSESVLQAFPAVEESGAFYFHALKLDSDLFALMIDARPCVAVFSIPDASVRQEICTLLENFRKLRESLGYPKRDPTLRTILVAEEKAISLEHWHDLGVHEFIIAPILPRALAFKISRHYQKAAAAPVPDPYDKPDETIVVRGSSKFEWEEKQAYGRGPREKEVALSEVADPAKGIRTFVGEKTTSREKYSVLASIPELKEEDGQWEKLPEDHGESQDAKDPVWGWNWKQPPSEGRPKGSWNFRGERPQFDSKRGAWNLSGEKPALEVKRDGAQPEKIIQSVDTKRGREIVVRGSDESQPRRENRLDILEVKQTPTEPASGFGRGIGGAERQAQAYRNRTHESETATRASSRGTGTPKSESDTSADESATEQATPSIDPAEASEKPGWTQHVSQSQRSLERTLMTEPDRVVDRWNVDMEKTAPEDLPPALQEISKHLLGESSEETTPEKAPPASQPRPGQKPEDSSPSAPAERKQDSTPTASPSLKVPAKEEGAQENEIPEGFFPDGPDEPETNPYLDGRSSPPAKDEPESGPAPGHESEEHGVRDLRSHIPADRTDRDQKSETQGRGENPPPTGENLTALESSKLAKSYNSNFRRGAFPAPENNIKLSSSKEGRGEDFGKVLSQESGPNTWSMQNLDEQGVLSKKNRKDGERPGSSEDPSAEIPQSGEGQLFETGATPSLEQISAQIGIEPTPEALEAALREGKIPEWVKLPEEAERDKAWFSRFWRRVQVLLRKIGR